MIVLRSALFNLLFFGYTALKAIALAPTLLRRDHDFNRLGHGWADDLAWLLAHVVGITHELRGTENIPDGPAVFAAKHQSAWETIMLHRLLPRTTFVVKRELFRIPLYGQYSRRAGSIGIDRKGGPKALRRMIGEAQAAIARGRRIVIFPEGTRTAPGERRPYHGGVYALYSRLDAPLVPVALNSGLYWGRRRFVKRPGRIVVEFLPAIPPGLDRTAFVAELERRIETATAALVAEAGCG